MTDSEIRKNAVAMAFSRYENLENEVWDKPLEVVVNKALELLKEVIVENNLDKNIFIKRGEKVGSI